MMFLLLFVILISLYKSDKAMIEIPQRYAESLREKTHLDFYPMWVKWTGYLFRLEDSISPFRIKQNLLDGGLPIYNLKLSPNDLGHFDNLSKAAKSFGMVPGEANTWRNAELNIDGKNYQVEASFHGDTPPHFSGELKSYQIKTARGKNGEYEFINSMRKFNLIIFEDRAFRSRLTRMLAQKFGLYDIKDDFVVLKINGVVQGVYYLQQSLDINFLESNECSNCNIIKTSDAWLKDHPYDFGYGTENNNGILWFAGHRTPFDYEIAYLDLDTEIPYSGKILYSVSNLYKAIREKDNNIINYFDIEQLSSFEAFRMLLGDAHIIVGDNLRLVYRDTNGKFYPVPLNEVIAELKLENGGIEHGRNIFIKPVDLFFLIAKNDELRHLRNKKIYGFIQNNNVIEEYGSLVEKYGPYALSYKTNGYIYTQSDSRHLKYQFSETRQYLQHNIEIIKKNLEYSKVYINAVQKANKLTIEVIPDSIAEIKFSSLKVDFGENEYSGKIILTTFENNSTKTKSIEIRESSKIDLTALVNDMFFSAGLDENLYPALRRYTLDFVFPGANGRIHVQGIEANMKNDITDVDMPPSDTYLQIADGNDYYEGSKYYSPEKFISEHPEFKWSYDGSELTLKGGSYIIKNDLIIPKTKRLNIEAGTSIRIAGNMSILSYSPVNFIGTREKPITITSIEKSQPFGVFAILGDGEQGQKTTISWLDLSNGNEKWINGAYFSGQLSVYHMPDVEIYNSQIHGSHSDDGLNIKYGNVIIDSSKFFDNYGDQIDLDFGNGVIKNSEFRGYKGADSNGDGLDISGSYVIIKNNIFTGLGDKGSSIGEKSTAVIYKNQYSDSNIGIASKDKSIVYSFENDFRNNQIAISAYQKKPLFGGAVLYEYNDALISNKKDYEADDKSSIIKLDLSTEQYIRYKNNIDKDIVPFPKNTAAFPIK